MRKSTPSKTVLIVRTALTNGNGHVSQVTQYGGDDNLAQQPFLKLFDEQALRGNVSLW